MLIKATAGDVERYCDFVYALALDPSRSCYPTYADGIKTKADFISNARKAVADEHRELLLYRSDAGFEGWLSYFWIPEDRYLQLHDCNIRSGTERALGELLEIIAERFPGYSLYFGFPGENTEAAAFLERSGFRCVEQEWNNTFLFDGYEPRDTDESVAAIGRENFGDFRRLHGSADAEVYWNCDRIYDCLDRWSIFVCYEDDVPVGTIFLTGFDNTFEVFGVEYADERYREDILRKLTTAALNHLQRRGAKYLTFFCDDRSLPALSSLGFRRVGKYLLYIKEG